MGYEPFGVKKIRPPYKLALSGCGSGLTSIFLSVRLRPLMTLADRAKSDLRTQLRGIAHILFIVNRLYAANSARRSALLRGPNLGQKCPMGISRGLRYRDDRRDYDPWLRRAELDETKITTRATGAWDRATSNAGAPLPGSLSVIEIDASTIYQSEWLLSRVDCSSVFSRNSSNTLNSLATRSNMARCCSL